MAIRDLGDELQLTTTDVHLPRRIGKAIEDAWEGDLDMRSALRNGSIKAQGLRHLVRTMPSWFGACLYKDVQPGDPKLMHTIAE